jgi:hypothetical protein
MTEEARSRREAMEQKDALLRRRFEFRSLVPEPHSAFAMCFFFHCYFPLGLSTLMAAVNDGLSSWSCREESRQDYLKKRKQQKLDELRDELVDEEYLFGGQKLTAREEAEFRYKKKVHELATKGEKDVEDVEEYRIPEAYDTADRVAQDRRFAVASDRYRLFLGS